MNQQDTELIHDLKINRQDTEFIPDAVKTYENLENSGKGLSENIQELIDNASTQVPYDLALKRREIDATTTELKKLTDDYAESYGSDSEKVPPAPSVLVDPSVLVEMDKKRGSIEQLKQRLKEQRVVKDETAMIVEKLQKMQKDSYKIPGVPITEKESTSASKDPSEETVVIYGVLTEPLTKAVKTSIENDITWELNSMKDLGELGVIDIRSVDYRNERDKLLLQKAVIGKLIAQGERYPIQAITAKTIKKWDTVIITKDDLHAVKASKT